MLYILAFQLNNGASSSGTFTTAGIPQGGDYVTCQKFASGAVSNLTLADISHSMLPLSAAWYWATNGLNTLADAGEFTKITTKVNGGQTGAADRQALYDAALAVLV
ncbi:hypothetical protein [Pseudomonas asplenii]|uniref:hypothetical protein n=1 Tax=Pseudomonas asplenii TaxID=53407 RepID=UPI0037C86DDC